MFGYVGWDVQYSPQKVATVFEVFCVLHSIAIHHGFLLEITKEIWKSLRLPMPFDG